jgi:hypothetical protein
MNPPTAIQLQQGFEVAGTWLSDRFALQQFWSADVAFGSATTDL